MIVDVGRWEIIKTEVKSKYMYWIASINTWELAFLQRFEFVFQADGVGVESKCGVL